MKRIICFLVAIFLANSASALNLVRDSELEAVLQEAMKPILEAAGLVDNEVDLYIVQDDELNAFVAGGKNLFINTGLLLRFPDPNVIIGVMAHETGHISAGHIARTAEKYDSVTLQTATTILLGAASIIAGQADAGMAIISAGGHIGERNFLQYTRIKEQAADNLGLKFMQAKHISADGLLTLLEELNKNEIQVANINQYANTHPLSQQRIETIRQFVANENYKNSPYKPDFYDRYNRAIIKLSAFLNPPEFTLEKYKGNNIEDLYARTIAYYQQHDWSNASRMSDLLISKEKNNPHFLELKGQIAFEMGDLKSSMHAYRNSLKAKSDDLVRLELGVVINSYAQDVKNQTEKNKLLNEAITNFKVNQINDPDSPFLFRQLAVSYGQLGKLGMSNLALAEEAKLHGNLPETMKFLQNAEKYKDLTDQAKLRIEQLKSDKSRQ